jgi:hypothetical protein
VTAGPDTTLFDAIPLYSSDLSKPFPLFDEAEHNYDSTWKQQLDDLQALWEQTTASGGGQNLGVGDGLPIQDLNIDGLFVDSSGSTSFGAALSSAPTSIPSASGIGVDLGSMGPSSTGSFSPDGQRLASASAPLQRKFFVLFFLHSAIGSCCGVYLIIQKLQRLTLEGAFWTHRVRPCGLMFLQRTSTFISTSSPFQVIDDFGSKFQHGRVGKLHLECELSQYGSYTTVPA